MTERTFKLLVASFKIIILCFIYTKAVDRPKSLGHIMEGKVVGGSYANISNFPHAVYLSMTCGQMNIICGSSIINQIILVTAAHCLQCQSLHISAQAGHENIKQVTVVRRAIKKKIHPSYSDTSLINDIALLLLSKNLPLGDNIKRVIIKPRYSQNNIAYVAGWGITNDETRSRSLQLKMVKVPLLSHKDCSVKMFPGMLCAGTLYSTKDRPSSGDSGSALITTKHQMLGIVSFRTEHIALLIYTNVSYYYSWIQKATKELYCSGKI